MEKIEIENLLIERSKIAAERAQFENGYKDMRAKLIPVEVQNELDSLDYEAKEALARVDEKLADFDAKIKAGTLEIGETVSVKGVAQAVYNHGRVSWNTDGLNGLAISLPAILQFKKEGEPYVTIR